MPPRHSAGPRARSAGTRPGARASSSAARPGAFRCGYPARASWRRDREPQADFIDVVVVHVLHLDAQLEIAALSRRKELLFQQPVLEARAEINIASEIVVAAEVRRVRNRAEHDFDALARRRRAGPLECQAGGHRSVLVIFDVPLDGVELSVERSREQPGQKLAGDGDGPGIASFA